MVLDDMALSEFRDYIVKGETGLHGEELRAWGVIWSQGDREWILFNTNEICPDYQAVIELGLDLLPIQERPLEKMVINQLSNRKMQ